MPTPSGIGAPEEIGAGAVSSTEEDRRQAGCDCPRPKISGLAWLAPKDDQRRNEDEENDQACPADLGQDAIVLTKLTRHRPGAGSAQLGLSLWRTWHPSGAQ